MEPLEQRLAAQRLRIAQVLRSTGLSLEALAERVNFKVETLRKYAAGYQPASERFMGALRRAEREAAAEGEAFSPMVSEEEPFPYNGRSKIKQAREARGLTLKQLGKLCGYPPAFLQDIEEGTSPVSERMAEALVQNLPGLTLEDLLSGSESPKIIDLTARTGSVGSTPQITLPDGRTARFVPRLSYTQAGALNEWTDDLYTYEGILAMDLPPKSRAFSVTIHGDSMEPRFFPGDDVIVLWGVEPRNGQVVVACTNKGEPVCKLYSAHDRGRRIILSSYNAAHHPPMEFGRDELRWIWPVHSVNRKVMHP